MDRHPIFFVTDWYIFEVVCWVFSTTNVFLFAFFLFLPVVWLLVNTSVNILYSL